MTPLWAKFEKFSLLLEPAKTKRRIDAKSKFSGKIKI